MIVRGVATAASTDLKEDRVPTIDELLLTASRNASDHATEGIPAPPSRHVVIVTCMDARVEPFALFGLEPGQAHVMRNAGGVVTDDIIRSLAISQRQLGTREILVMHHSACGMTTFSDDAFRAQIEEETGIRPPWSAEAFADATEDVRQSMRRILASPFIPHRDHVRGAVLDVADGTLREVTLEG